MKGSKIQQLKYIGLTSVWILAVFLAFPFRTKHSVLAPADKSNQQHATLAAETSNSQYTLNIDKFTTLPVDETSQTKRITLDITLNNVSSSAMQISPGLQMFILDDIGTLRPFTAKYLPANSIIGGQLNAGSSESYNIDFELPASVKPVAFHFEPGGDYQLTEIKL